MAGLEEFLKRWKQRAEDEGVSTDLAELGANVIRTLYDPQRAGSTWESAAEILEATERLIRFAVAEPDLVRLLWPTIIEQQMANHSTGTYGGVDDRELLGYRPGDFPWDRWEQRAVAAGMPEQLAGLGRSLMREAVQHGWEVKLQQQCGWADEGAALLRFGWNQSVEARRRWEYLIRTDGDRFLEL